MSKFKIMGTLMTGAFLGGSSVLAGQAVANARRRDTQAASMVVPQRQTQTQTQTQVDRQAPARTRNEKFARPGPSVPVAVRPVRVETVKAAKLLIPDANVHEFDDLFLATTHLRDAPAGATRIVMRMSRYTDIEAFALDVRRRESPKPGGPMETSIIVMFTGGSYNIPGSRPLDNPIDTAQFDYELFKQCNDDFRVRVVYLDLPGNAPSARPNTAIHAVSAAYANRQLFDEVHATMFKHVRTSELGANLTLEQLTRRCPELKPFSTALVASMVPPKTKPYSQNE